MSIVRCRHVTFDAFATLFSPRYPVHVQYAEVASRFGIQVDAERLKKSFKKAFKETEAELPVYGKAVGKTPEYWWSQIISRSFTAAGVPSSTLSPQLPSVVPALIHRFASSDGYTLHPDVLPTLSALRGRGISMSAVSNSDPRVEGVLRSLGVSPEFIAGEEVVTSWDVGVGKPDARIWKEAIKREREKRNREGRGEPVLREDEVLHVGDNLQEDYLGARKAGLQAVLLRRPDDASSVQTYQDSDEEGLSSVTVITSLSALLTLPQLSPS